MKALDIIKPYLWRYRWHFVFGTAFVFLANIVTMWVPLLVGGTINMLTDGGLDQTTLLYFAWGIICVAGVGACFRFLMRRVLIDASRDMEYEFRNDFFERMQHLDPAFYDSNNTGDLMSRATNDIDALRMMIGPAIMYATNTFFGFPMKFGAMLVLDWKLALLSIIPMALLPPLVKYFSHQTYVLSKEQQDSFGTLTTMIQENLAGIRVVKSYRQESAQREKFLERNNEYINKSLDLARVQASFFPSLRLIISLSSAALLAFGGYRVIQGDMEVGTLLAFLLLFAEIVWPLIAAGWVINIIQRGFASLERIGKVMNAEPMVQDTAKDADVPKGPLSIQFKNLTFTYEGTHEAQLKNIDLDVPAGKTIGIVGPVGSGKSTLIHVLARLYPVERGMVEMNGRDINDWPLEAVRKRLAFVFQETFLFSDSIGWNIRFGASDNQPQEDVERVARMADVHKDISEMPKGYLTILGERGVNLSGGQKQRVAIARALLREADVLILDDSLSAVDTHTEETILNELKKVMKGKTTFLVSHRISTVALADEILVLDHGTITERGNHEELVAQGGMYSELYKKQLSEAEIEQFEEELTEEVKP